MWTRLPCHPSHLTHIVSVSQPPSLRVRRGDLETADISDYSWVNYCYCSGDITLRMRKVLAIPPSLWLVCFSAEISVTIEYPCCYNKGFFQRQVIMHCLSAQALIPYPDLTLFFGRGRSGYEITQAPLVLLWYVCLRVACFRFSDCGDGAGRWERGFKKALPLPLFLIISPLSHFAFHPTIRTPGIGYCKRRLSNFVKIVTKLIPSMFHKSLPQTTLRAVVSQGIRSVAG